MEPRILEVQFEEESLHLQSDPHYGHHGGVPLYLLEVVDEEVDGLQHDGLAEFQCLLQPELAAVHQIPHELGQVLAEEVLLELLGGEEELVVPVAVEDDEPLVELLDVGEVVVLLGWGDLVNTSQLVL